MQQKLHSAQWFNFHFINKTDMKKSEKIAQTEISAPKNSIQIALFFFVGHHVGHLVPLHVARHVSQHVGHRNVVSTLCEVSETLKCMTDQPVD